MKELEKILSNNSGWYRYGEQTLATISNIMALYSINYLSTCLPFPYLYKKAFGNSVMKLVVLCRLMKVNRTNLLNLRLKICTDIAEGKLLMQQLRSPLSNEKMNPKINKTIPRQNTKRLSVVNQIYIFICI